MPHPNFHLLVHHRPVKGKVKVSRSISVSTLLPLSIIITVLSLTIDLPSTWAQSALTSTGTGIDVRRNPAPAPHHQANISMWGPNQVNVQRIIIRNDGTETHPKGPFILLKSETEFVFRLFINWTLSDNVFEIKDELEFRSQIQLHAKDQGLYVIALQNQATETEASTKIIDSQTIQFASAEKTDQTVGNNITLVPAEFRVTRIKNVSATEIPPAFHISVKSWLHETDTGEEGAISSLNNASHHDVINYTAWRELEPFSVMIRPDDCINSTYCKSDLKISNVRFTNAMDQNLTSFTIGSQSDIFLKFVVENNGTEDAVRPGAFIRYVVIDDSRNGAQGDPSQWPLSSWTSAMSADSMSHMRVVCDHPNDTSPGAGPTNNNPPLWPTVRCHQPDALLPPKHRTRMELRLNMSRMGLVLNRYRLRANIFLADDYYQISGFPDTAIQEIQLLTAKIQISGNHNNNDKHSLVMAPKQTEFLFNKKFLHTYNVTLSGQGSVGNVSLEFYIPLGKSIMTDNIATQKKEGQGQGQVLTQLEFGIFEAPKLTDISGAGASLKLNCEQSTDTEMTPRSMPRTTTASSKTEMVLGIEPRNTGAGPSGAGTGILRTGNITRQNSTTQIHSGNGTATIPTTTKATKTEESLIPRGGSVPQQISPNFPIELSCSRPNSEGDHMNFGEARTTCRHYRCTISNVSSNAALRVTFQITATKGKLDLTSKERMITFKSEGVARILDGQSENHVTRSNSQNTISLNAQSPGKSGNSGVHCGAGLGVWFYVMPILIGSLFIY